MPQNDVSNLSDTIVPKSDQLNADALLAAPLTITVTGVSRGNAEQPVTIHYDGDQGQPYKPCKSMRKVLIFAWGDDGRTWAGKSMTLFNNPEVKWGGVKVGGIRISHLSDIPRDLELSLADTKGKKSTHTIRKLVVQKAAAKKAEQKPAADAPPSATQIEQAKADLKKVAAQGMGYLQAAWKATPVTMRAAISPDGTCPADLKAIATKADNPPAQAEPPAPANDNAVSALNQAAAAVAAEPAQKTVEVVPGATKTAVAAAPAPAATPEDDDVF